MANGSNTDTDTAVALRRELRIAKLVASNVPVLSAIPGTAGGRWTNHYRALANKQVRQIHRQMHKLGIDPNPKFFKPRPVAGLERIRRQYTGDPGWDNEIGVRFDERGPYFTYPAVPQNVTVDSPGPTVVIDPQPAIPPNAIVCPRIECDVTPMMNLRTIGQLAKELRVDQHKVLYVIRVRKIQPIARAGMYRLFDDSAVARIASELQQIASVR